jgi:hypothetical protein
VKRDHAPISVDLAELPGMSLAQLREVWSRLHDSEASSRRKCATSDVAPPQASVLAREIAWRVQAASLPDGGLDAVTRRLLDAAVRSVTTGRSAVDVGTPRSRVRLASSMPLSRNDASTTLPTGARLVRVFRGVKHEVQVLEGGRAFIYRDRRYTSLSSIAREITGTVWSGPVFFGLTTRARPHGGDA